MGRINCRFLVILTQIPIKIKTYNDQEVTQSICKHLSVKLKLINTYLIDLKFHYTCICNAFEGYPRSSDNCPIKLNFVTLRRDSVKFTCTCACMERAKLKNINHTTMVKGKSPCLRHYDLFMAQLHRHS